MTNQRLEQILSEALNDIAEAKNSEEMNVVRNKYLSKKCELASMSSIIGTLPTPEEKKAFGAELHEVKTNIEKAIEEKSSSMAALELEAKLKAEQIDISLPGRSFEPGARNPFHIIEDEMKEIFLGMGFEVADGPEVETDNYNFELLNIPKDHPARDMQDTFYIDENTLLRTHTSPVQARTMAEKKGQPIRIICPGKTYRRDDDDATHSHQFAQIEGLVVDKNINIGHLKATLELFAKKMFGEKREIRLRPSYFPFTEPSVEVDITCANCGGNLVFFPRSQKLHCANCESEFDIQKGFITSKRPLESANEDIDAHDSWVKEAKVCKCKTCGASIIIQGLNITEQCPYCASDYVLDKDVMPGIKPDSVVPFAFDEVTASETFAKGVKKIFLIPRAFKKKIPSNKIRGIYVPSFAFDAHTDSKYKGVLVKEHKHTDSKGNTRTTYEYINISGTKLLDFTNVTIESSSKMQNKDMKSLLPYNLDSEYVFTPDFIRGFSTEHYEDSIEACYSIAKDEMKAQIKARILNEYKSRYHYDSVKSFFMDTMFSNEGFLYRLLPVYCFEFIYKKKQYITFMNGQTGKIGTGYPKSYFKVFMIVLIILAIIAAILGVYYYTKLH